MAERRRLDADVLVIGGGMAGAFAALTAREAGHDVRVEFFEALPILAAGHKVDKQRRREVLLAEGATVKGVP